MTDEKRLAEIQAIKDKDIDTSDIPEQMDLNDAVRKSYRPLTFDDVLAMASPLVRRIPPK